MLVESRVGAANRPGNGGLRTGSDLWEHLLLFWTGSRNAPLREGPCFTHPTVAPAVLAVGKVQFPDVDEQRIRQILAERVELGRRLENTR